MDWIARTLSTSTLDLNVDEERKGTISKVGLIKGRIATVTKIQETNILMLSDRPLLFVYHCDYIVNPGFSEIFLVFRVLKTFLTTSWCFLYIRYMWNFLLKETYDFDWIHWNIKMGMMIEDDKRNGNTSREVWNDETSCESPFGSWSDWTNYGQYKLAEFEALRSVNTTRYVYCKQERS